MSPGGNFVRVLLPCARSVSAVAATGVAHLPIDATCSAPCLLYVFPPSQWLPLMRVCAQNIKQHILSIKTTRPIPVLEKRWSTGRVRPCRSWSVSGRFPLVFAVELIILTGQTLPHIQPAPASFQQRPRPAFAYFVLKRGRSYSVMLR